MNLINSPAPISLLNAFGYLFKNRTLRSRRTRLAPVFLLSLVGTFFILALSSTIKGMDLVLHYKDIVPIVIRLPSPAPNVGADATIAEGCSDSHRSLCPVSARASDARLGALNISDVYRVYSYQPANLSVGSLAFIAPPDLTNLSIIGAHTYAAGTTCKAYHPSCSQSKELIYTCRPDTGELSNSSIYDVIAQYGFDITHMQDRMQIFLLSNGDVDVDSDPLALPNGANTNPLNFVTFGCFDDYANVQYDLGTTPPFKTPFTEWWSAVEAVANKSPKLCSISVCNTTFYDASYSAQNGIFILDANRMQAANQSATLALSGAAVYIGSAGNSTLYRSSNTYMDEMLQVDLSAAGNVYGNNTQKFADAWGMSISNRLLGWSAKAIELRPIPEDIIQYNDTLMLSINLVSAYAFTIVHFVYAVLIVLLGVSCAFIPASVISDAPSQEYADGKRPADVRATQTKLSDFSTLLLEVHDARGTGSREQRPLRSRSTTSLSISDVDEQNVEGRVRLGLKRRSDGTLGLDFHNE